MRVEGTAVVVPQHLATVAAPVDGNVDKVYAHEGQRVAAGEILGTLNDWQWRANLAAAEAKYQQAMLAMENDLAHGSARAGADRANADYLRSEVAQARTRLESAQLRSPIAGIVVTPNLQNAAGEHLDAGAPFAQVLDLNSAVVRDCRSRAGRCAADIPAKRPRSNLTAIRSGPGTMRFLWSARRQWLATASVPSLPKSRWRTMTRILRAGMSGKGKISIGLTAGRVCAAAAAGFVDLADAVELDWLVSYASSLEVAGTLFLSRRRPRCSAQAAKQILRRRRSPHRRRRRAFPHPQPCRRLVLRTQNPSRPAARLWPSNRPT